MTWPIVAVSSDDRPGDATRFREFGVATHATMPVSRQELLRLVQDASRVVDHPEADTSSTAAQPPTTIEQAGRATRLAVAEDSIDRQFLIDAYLKNAGYELKIVTNGKEASRNSGLPPTTW